MDSIKIKLAVDRSRNRVLFADAGSDFVDVLLTFLTLPFSVLQFCAAGAWLPGCLSNLCDSVSRLRESKLLKVEACHGMLLTPSTAHEFGEDNFCFNNDEFVKSQPNLQVDGEFCTCWLVMARLMCVYREATSSSHGKFVRCKERFVISDDCTIKPASTTAMRSLTHSFDSGAILHDFEEVEVCVSWAEVVSMLKACFSSETILTDVFLLMDTHVTVKLPGTNQKILVTPNDDSVILSEFHTRLFYDMKEKKVMYAECRHELVDLLLGFLTYPLGHVIKNMLTSPLGIGGFHNLYMSAVKLDEAGFITGGHPTETLLNPALSPFCRRPECSTLKEDLVEPENLFMGLVSYGSCSGCRNDLVEDRKYVVGDDLVVHQASAMSVMKHWCGRDNANVVEMDITITKEEAVLLLRAMYTSKTPLTDVFISRLEEHSSLQKMQISVKIPTGKIGSVEVSRFDTIATVKSRIEEKVPIPAGRRHELVYGSKTLEDSCTAADYNLVSKCTITCKFRRANDYEDYEPLV